MQSHLYRLRVSIYEPANIIPHSRLLPEFSRNRFDNGDNRFLSRVKKAAAVEKSASFCGVVETRDTLAGEWTA